MVSWLPHLLIPLLVALVLMPMARRQILLLSPLVWLPDLDYIFPSEHRAISHSAFIPMALLVTVVVLWRRRDPSARLLEYATRPGHPGNLLLATYFIASHLLLDVFQGGVVLFWPILDVNFYWYFELLLDTATNTFTPEGEVGTSEGAPALSPTYPWISSEHTAILAFLATVAGGWAAIRYWSRRTPAPARPVVVERQATLQISLRKE